MKKEILLDNICRLRSDIRICGISIRDKQTDDNYIKALDEVIEIIEKEPLKDIRTEIENVKNDPLFNKVSNNVVLEVVLTIIDKYLEKEEEEWQ